MMFIKRWFDGQSAFSPVPGYSDAVKCSFIRSAFNVAELSMNQRIGYARVSTDDQNLDLQRDALRQAGCSTIYEEAASGKSAARQELEQCRKALRAGDTLVVWRLDRLGRSLPDLVQITSDIELSGAGCTTAITPNQLVQSSSENDNTTLLIDYRLDHSNDRCRFQKATARNIRSRLHCQNWPPARQRRERFFLP